MHIDEIQSVGPEVRAARPHRVAPTREAKTARRLLWLIPTTIVVLFVSTRLIVTSETFSSAAAAYIASDLASRTHSAVQLSGVTLGYDFAPCFQNFEIYRFSGAYKIKATTKQACIERWASAVGSGFHAIRLRLEQPSIELEGTDAKAEPSAAGTVKKTSSSTVTVARKAALREVQVVFDDLRLDWKAMPFPSRFANGTFGPIDGAVTMQLRGGKTAATLSIREPRTGSQINGRIDPTTDGNWDMSAGVEGDLVPIFGTLLTSAGLDIRKMPSRGTIGALLRTKQRTATIELDLEQNDIDLANNLVSSNRLVGFNASEQCRISIDLSQGLVVMKDGLVEVNGVPVVLSLDVSPGENSPKFDFRADLKTTPFLKLLRSVPGAPEPVLTKELSPDVMFALSFSVNGNLRDATTWAPKLETRMTGLGPHGEGSGLEILKTQFRFYPLTREGRSPNPRIMGPGSPMWVPYARIPYLQRRTVTVSEDASFFVHNGIQLEEMQDAIKEGMSSDEKTRGGSTITQQLVKNLFLTRDRTALRKIQEALLTFHLEASLTKEQILELYMNMIEWGPDVYGIKEASMHYFGKRPESLNVKEMAYLATIIPGPILYHQYYEQGFVPAKHMSKVDLLMERLTRLGNLTESQLAEAKETKLHFVRSTPKEKK